MGSCTFALVIAFPGKMCNECIASNGLIPKRSDISEYVKRYSQYHNLHAPML